LQLVYNSGVAFSIGVGFGLPVAVVTIALLAFFGLRGRRSISVPMSIAIGLIAGGALSNLADRLFRGDGGSVIDFIHSTFWPTFNIADSAVVCGCVMVVVIYWKSSGTKEALTAQRPPNERHDLD
jgi:signal peptidase II